MKSPLDYYYKLFDQRGTDVTFGVHPENATAIKGSRTKFLNTSSTLLDTTLNVSNYLFLDFYDSKTDTLIQSYYLKRLSFYPKLAKQTPRHISNPESTITFEFANKDKLPDHVWEYRLKGRGRATAWKTTGFILQLDYLRTATYYQLETRYVFQPESVEQYYFNIGPVWYENWRKWLISPLVIVIFVLVNRSAKTNARRKQEAIEQKLRIVQSQLNPHFIFNSLSSIQSMMNTGRINEANVYLSEFSSLMRGALNVSDKIYNPLDNEISILGTYLKLEQIRFGFDYKISVQHGINSSEIELPVLLLQPMVENAVKHGVSGLKEKGLIKINFFSEGRKFICRISDNGKGYSQEQQEYGYGFRLTNDRIKLINEMTKHKTVELKVDSSEGTVIKVIFNDWL